MQAKLEPIQDLCVALCRMLHTAFLMADQQQPRDPQVAKQLFQHLGAAARPPVKHLPVPSEQDCLLLLLRVGDSLHGRDGYPADRALQRFEDYLLWTPEVRCMHVQVRLCR